MKRLAIVLGLATISTPTFAAPITYTGAEFANLPGITFPTGTQAIVGDSLRIDAVNYGSVVAALPLDQFNINVSDFEVQVNITRLRRDDGAGDQDPSIYLSDGLNLFAGSFNDFSIGTIDARVRRDELSSDGQSLIFREFIGDSQDVFVPINNTYLATVRVQATDTNTTITADINNGAASISGSTTTLFNLSNGGPSLILSSNNFNENYLINSVTFTRGVSAPDAVVEPGAFGGLALGLATVGFGLYRRRTR